jgi:hypothetical protein
MSKDSIHLTMTSYKTLLLTLPFLALFLGIGEVIMRQQLVQAYLDTPTLNSSHRHLERQWHRLETLTKLGVSIDCIALGNSMILNGFDPQIFGQSFESNSGRKLSCFNFGVDALTPVSAAALAQILVETYHPQLLIFGTDARDFAIPKDSGETTVITNMAWIKYRKGTFNIEGWLVEHSYFYRYRHRLADLVRLSLNKRYETDDHKYGYEPQETVVEVTTPPDPNDPSYHVQYYYRTLSNYTIQPDNTDALADIVKEKEYTEVVVVEMPVPETYFYFFDHPEADYESFMDTLRTITTNNQVLLLETTQEDLIPDDKWMDYSHVNQKGAILFSEWLGQKLGRALVDGSLRGLLP